MKSPLRIKEKSKSYIFYYQPEFAAQDLISDRNIFLKGHIVSSTN